MSSHHTLRKHLLSNLLYHRQSGVEDYIASNPINYYQQYQQLLKKPQQHNDMYKKVDIPAIEPIRENLNNVAGTISDSESDTIQKTVLKAPYQDIVDKTISSVSQCSSLEELREFIDNFVDCGLKKTAKNLVFSDGNPNSGLVFVGEAPGKDEDIQGKPFVGRSGQLLNNMLASINIDRSQCYITNILPWRPPGNRTPSDEEKAICFPLLSHHISLLNPKMIVLLGGVACREILQTTEGIMRLRGQTRILDKEKFNTKNDISVVMTLHPAYLLRQPLHKRLVWHDFQLVQRMWNEKLDNK